MKNNLKLDEKQSDLFAEAAIKHVLQQELRTKYTKILNEKKDFEKNNKKRSYVTLFIKSAVVAASFIGCVFLIQEFQFSSSKEIAQNLLGQTNISGSPMYTRKGNRNPQVSSSLENKISDNELTQILRKTSDAFNVKNYNLAIKNYNEIERRSKLTVIDKFYLGFCHLQNRSYFDAIKYLKDIKSNEKIKIEEVDWLLSLAYIMVNNEKNAKPLLEEIKNTKSYKSKEARQLLKSMK